VKATAAAPAAAAAGLGYLADDWSMQASKCVVGLQTAAFFNPLISSLQYSVSEVKAAAAAAAAGLGYLVDCLPMQPKQW
jgi:hypothetical protein